MPALVVETSAPVTSNVGRPVPQKITVRNVGAVPADQVEVRARFSILCELLATQPEARVDDSALVWKLGRMEVGAAHELLVQVKPLATGELSCQANVSFAASSTVKVQVREPKLNLQVQAPSDLLIGANGRAIVTVSNTGTGPAENVVLRQALQQSIQPAGGSPAAQPLHIEIGTLQPGDSRTLEAGILAQQAGSMQFRLVVESSDGVQASAVASVRVRQAKLTVSVLGPAFRYVGRQATYQIIVMNRGDATAEHAQIMTAIPAGFEVIDVGAAGVVDAEHGTIRWKVGHIPAGEGRGVLLTLKGTAAGEHLFRTVASASGNLLVKADTTIRIQESAAPTLKVTDSADPAEVGSIVHYEIHVSNRGSKTADAVEITGELPEGIEFIDAEGPTHYRRAGQQVIFAPIANLEPKAEHTYRIGGKATKPGTGAFKAQLTSTSIPAAMRTEETTLVSEQ
jgi:uncharacterized repeat protein (TIGR01451 family)